MSTKKRQQANDPRRRRGALCLEGEWGENLLNQTTVQPLVAYAASVLGFAYVHRRVQNRDGLLDLVQRWCTEMDLRDYEILYLAAHGSADLVTVGAYSPVTDVSFADMQEAIGEAGEHRILYLGSCSDCRTIPRSGPSLSLTNPPM